MTLTQIPPLPTRGPPPRTQPDPRTVVRLLGEHDVSTVPTLSVELAREIARSDADLVLDLRDVQFMDASTVGVIIGAREFLRSRGRSLTLRSLSAIARRVIVSCDLEDLVERRTSSWLPQAGLPAVVAEEQERRVVAETSAVVGDDGG